MRVGLFPNRTEARAHYLQVVKIVAGYLLVHDLWSTTIELGNACAKPSSHAKSRWRRVLVHRMHEAALQNSSRYPSAPVTPSNTQSSIPRNTLTSQSIDIYIYIRARDNPPKSAYCVPITQRPDRALESPSSHVLYVSRTAPSYSGRGRPRHETKCLTYRAGVSVT